MGPVSYRESTPQAVLENLGGAMWIAGMLLTSSLTRRWYNRWGATPAEQAGHYPGDDLVPQPRLTYTRAITIQAPADEVWPWLIQIGQGRGALYSYELLENIARCDMHNAGAIVPEWQTPQVGDKVRLGPEGYPFYWIGGYEPGRWLLLVTGDLTRTETGFARPDPLPEKYVLDTWCFVVEPLAGQASRLILRGRQTYAPDTFANRMIWRVITEPMGFVMMRQMLIGIKRRAEAARRRG